MSHCHGFHPTSQFCAQLQRCCGMDAVGGERALTAASDASREPMMLMRRSRVHSGATAQSGDYWPHLLDGGTSPPVLERYHIKQSSICTFMRPGGRAGTESVSCCLKICPRGTGHGRPLKSDRTGQQSLWARFRKSLSERRHRDRAGRMESGCVRVLIPSATIEGLLPPASSHVTLRSSTLLHWLICRAVTYKDTF